MVVNYVCADVHSCIIVHMQVVIISRALFSKKNSTACVVCMYHKMVPCTGEGMQKLAS